MNDRDFKLLTARISLRPPMQPAKRAAELADAARIAIRSAARRISRISTPRRPA